MVLEFGVVYLDLFVDGLVIQCVLKWVFDYGMNIVKVIELGGEMKKNGVNILIIFFMYYNFVL